MEAAKDGLHGHRFNPWEHLIASPYSAGHHQLRLTVRVLSKHAQLSAIYIGKRGEDDVP
jgi:hypothetical protein